MDIRGLVPEGQWKRRCESSACFEAAVVNGKAVLRLSGNPEDGLIGTVDELAEFVAAAKHGAFDSLVQQA